MTNHSYKGAPDPPEKKGCGRLGGGWGILLLVVLALILLGALVFGIGLAGGHMGGYGGVCPWCGGRGMMGGWGILATVLALALSVGFVILLVLGVLVLVRGGAGDAFLGSPSATPREILDRRYARGEISQEEYRRMTEDLEV